MGNLIAVLLIFPVSKLAKVRSKFNEAKVKRDAKGRFAPKDTASFSRLEKLKQQYRQKLLANFDDSAKNNIIIHEGKTYNHIFHAEGEHTARSRLNSHIDKISSFQVKKQIEVSIRKQREKALKELHPHSNLSLDEFQKYRTEEFDSLLERYKQKKREEAKNRRQKRELQKKVDQQITKGKLAFDNAPDNLKAAIKKYGHPPIIPPRKDSGPFFSPLINKIHMNSIPDRDFPSIYMHEWGHYLDYRIGGRSGLSSSPEGKKAFNEDAAKGRTNYGKALRKIDDGDHNAFFKIADTAGALTNNKIGFGHTSEYFSRPGNREAEAFANIVSLVGSGNPKLIEAAKTIAPKTYALLMDKLNE